MAENTGATLVSQTPATGIVLPPANVDAPYVSQVAAQISCTMGNWNNMQAEPHSYAYQWKADGTNIVGAVQPRYTVTAPMVGHSLMCVVTATNVAGSASVNSNAVVAV